MTLPFAPTRLLPGVLLVMITLAVTPVRAGDMATPPDWAEELEPGDVVQGFSLRDLDGSIVHLFGSPAATVTVLAFNGLGCPIAELYAPRLEAFHQEFRARGVRVLGLNSNAHDRIPELRGFANAFGITFPILKDHDHSVADLLGVERTTEVLVLDADRRLRYRGRVDDQYSLTDRSVGVRKSRPEVHYLRRAVDAVLRGEAVATSRTEAVGCVIGRRTVAAGSTTLRYHEHIEPIIQKRCQPCHRHGEIAPFELLTYDDVAGWSGMIREVVLNRRMPPWHADPDFGEFENDRSLSPEELDTIVAWIDHGAPRGDPAASPPPPEYSTGWTIGEPDAVFEIPRSFAIPAEGTLPYKYTAVETRFDEDRWVVASEIQPGDPGVVHHVLIFAMDPENPRRWRRETGGGTRGYFAIMVPGERPTIYPAGMAKRLPAGATLIFQIHYTANGRATEDRSRVGLVFADGPPRHEVLTGSTFNRRGLIIPPRAEHYPITAYHRFQRPVMLLSFLPHAHLRGEAFRYDLHYPATVSVSRPPDWTKLPLVALSRASYDAAAGGLTWCGELGDDVSEALLAEYPEGDDRLAIVDLQRRGKSETLLSVPRYDFGWQSSYRLKTPKRVPAGSMLECEAHFDNSPFNPALTEDMYSKAVVWGDQTWEEMLIGYFDYVASRREF